MDYGPVLSEFLGLRSTHHGKNILRNPQSYKIEASFCVLSPGSEQRYSGPVFKSEPSGPLVSCREVFESFLAKNLWPWWYSLMFLSQWFSRWATHWNHQATQVSWCLDPTPTPRDFWKPPDDSKCAAQVENHCLVSICPVPQFSLTFILLLLLFLYYN